MARGKTPNHYRRPRSDDLPRLLDNVRMARKQVLIAEGHLLAHRLAEDDAARAAWSAGATHRELAEAVGHHHRPGYVVPGLRRIRRRGR